MSFNFLDLCVAKKVLNIAIDELYTNQPSAFRIEANNGTYTVGKFIIKFATNMPIKYQVLANNVPIYTTSEHIVASTILVNCSMNTEDTNFSIRQLPDKFDDDVV